MTPSPVGVFNPVPASTIVMLDLTNVPAMTTLPSGFSTAVVVARNGPSYFPVGVTPSLDARTEMGVFQEFTLRIPELAVDATFSPQEIGYAQDRLIGSLFWATGSKVYGTDGEVNLYVLNPDPQFLRYDTFGVWSVSTSAAASSITIGALSLGAATPDIQIPGAGTASYEGIMNATRLGVSTRGEDITARADALVDFARRQIEFRTFGTISEDFQTRVVTSAPGLDMSGTLSYAAGGNSVSGTLITSDGMSGPATARFAGPAAAELGGVFLLADPSDTRRLIGGFSVRAP